MGLPILNWKKMLTSLGFRLRQSQGNSRQTRQTVLSHTHQLETLEPRHLLDGAGLDFADAPASYAVTLANDGARHDENAVTWQQLGDTIVGEGGGDQKLYGGNDLNFQHQFGDSLALSDDGSTIAIGARGNNGNGSDSGHTRIYRWDGVSWNQLGSDIDGEAANDHAGKAVALSGDGNTVVIGAEENDGTANKAGHARVYRWDGTAWNQLGSDLDGALEKDTFGASVSISKDGNIIAVGAREVSSDGDWSYSGGGRVYQWDGTHWNQLGDNLGPANDVKGRASIVSLSDDGFTVAVGNCHAQGENRGHTGIYRWDGATWNQLGSDIEGEDYTDLSGRAVSLSGDGDVVAIGATWNDGTASSSGHARVFGWDGAAWNQLGGDLDGEAS